MKTIERKTLLYKTDVEYGDYTINHVLGCSHGCLFPCYAFNLKKRFGIIKNYEDWLEPRIVSNALELLDREIPKMKKDIKSVHLSFTTDPFMTGYPDVNDLTIKIVNRLNKDKIKVVLLTKGIIPDSAIETQKYNEYGITLISLDEKFREKFEPYASPYEERIRALRKMHDAGFKTWVSIEPYPTPNIQKQDLKEVLNAISFVDYIVFGRWHYNKNISSYKERDAFYNECSKEIISFCKKKKIRYHIKTGTMTDDKKE